MKPFLFARFRPLLAPFFLGVLTVAGFAPFDIFILPVVTLAVLFRLWAHAPARHAAWIGLAFGLGLFGAGVNWVYVSLHDFGGMPLPIAVIATTLFCTVLALFPAAVGWLQARIGGAAARHYLLSLPALWVLLEWLRGWIFTGFPWLSVGYAQAPYGPLAGFAPLLGLYGVSLTVALSAGSLALLSERATHRRFAPLPLALLAALWLAGWGLQQVEWTKAQGAPITVSLLQGNVPQELKWRPEKAAATLELYRDLALKSRGRLIVMPETALPMFIDEVPRAYFEQLAAHANRLGGDILVGVPEFDGKNYYNSVLGFGAAPVQIFRKSHLVPFGEFIPLKPFGPWLVHQVLNIPLDDFMSGADNQALLAVAGQKLALAVCYEDAFGEEMIRQLPQATMLVNVSNDAWFGDSVAPWQHLQIARMRALETGRTMLRATNTGVTAILDQHGKTVKLAPQLEVTRLDGTAQGFSGATPYVRGGNIPVLLITVLMLAALRWRRS
jgi:apolipoprotein N-acyltransferase